MLSDAAGQRQPSVAVLQGWCARELRLLRASKPRSWTSCSCSACAASPDEDLLTSWEGFPPPLPLWTSLEGAPTLSEGDHRECVREHVEPTRRSRGRARSWPTSTHAYWTSEIEYLQTEVDREYRADLRQNVISILLDIFEQQSAAQVRGEVTELLDVLMVHMLSAAQFQNVAYLIRESQVTASRAADLQPALAQQLAQIPARLSAPEPLTQLLQSLDEAATMPAPADLVALFEQLRGPALATVPEWLSRIQNVKLRLCSRRPRRIGGSEHG